MGRIQVESSQSSSATHRLTQPSTTRDRRSIKRPTTLAIEEASRTANTHAADQPSTPSRLVNLRVTTTELEAARAAEEAEAAKIVASTPAVTMYPAMVEFGTAPTSNANDSAMNAEASAIAAPSVAAPVSTPDITPVAMANPVAPDATVEPTPPAQPAEIDTNALAMNIAADYAAASMSAAASDMGAMMTAPAFADPNNSVDDIAQAAAEAIASIRVATEPSQVSEQVASLKAFADNIKAHHDTPEMRELGDTIEKFVNVAMKSSAIKAEAAANSVTPITLTPKVTRAANKVTKSSAKVMASQQKAMLAARKKAKPISRTVAKKPAMARKPNPEELKDRAIEQALHSIATMDEERQSRHKKSAGYAEPRRKLRPRHVAIALSLATACVAGILYFVGSNIPDISVQVAAIQTGIQAAYPSYIPRDYSLGDVSAEDGKISMIFNAQDGSSFTLIEEKSSWDSAALQRNFVEANWQDNYTTTHEQGITIYINNANSNAAWVNGGVLYKITSSGTVLTKKQVRNIVVSL